MKKKKPINNQTLTGGLFPNGHAGTPDQTLTGGITPDSPAMNETLTKTPGIKRVSEAEIPDWNIGDVLDNKYRIVEKIGQGGMGLVYKIHHLEWNMDMALKMPLPHLVSDDISNQRFIREAQTWVELGLHPNIVQCYYVRNIEGLPRVFMDYIKGGSLKEWIQNGRIQTDDWETILHLMIQACDGLSYAHKKGLIHRDIKPANMMIDEHNTLFVTDFGLVKITGIEDIQGATLASVSDSINHSLTQTGAVMGTPEYGAPEQWTANGQITPCSDIYSLGVVLFELCCGRRPFDDGINKEPPHVLIGRHLGTEIPFPSTFNKNIPKPLEQIICKSLNKHSRNRPSDINELRTHLADLFYKITGKDFPYAPPEEASLRASFLNNQAVSLWDLQFRESALEKLNQALTYDPLHLEATKNNCLLTWKNGYVSEKVFLNKLTAMKSNHMKNPLYWRFLGELHTVRRDLEKCIDAHRQWLSLEPNNQECRELLKKRIEEKENKINYPECLRDIKEHRLQISSIVFSADGNTFFSSGKDEQLYQWKTETGEKITRFSEETRNFEITSMAVSDDGQFLVTGHKYIPQPGWMRPEDLPFIKKWSIPEKKCVHHFTEFPEIDIDHIILSNNSKYIIGFSSSIGKFDFNSGKYIQTFYNDDNKHFSVSTAIKHPIKNHLYSVDKRNNILHIHDIDSGDLLNTFPLEKNLTVTSMAFTANHSRIHMGTDKNSIIVLDLSEAVYRIYDLGETTSDYIPKINLIGTSSNNRFTFLAGGLLGKTKDYKQQRGIAKGLSDNSGFLRVQDQHSGIIIRTFDDFTTDVTALAVHSKQNIAITGDHHGNIRSWKLDFPVTAVLPALSISRITSYKKTSEVEKQYFQLIQEAETSFNKQNYTNTLSVLKHIRSLKDYERDPRGLDLWNQLGTKISKHSLYAYWEKISYSNYQPNTLEVINNQLICFPEDNCLNFLNLSDNTIQKDIKVSRSYLSEKTVQDIHVVDDGRLVIASSTSSPEEDCLQVWNYLTYETIMSFKGHEGSRTVNYRDVRTCAISPDKTKVLSGGMDNTVRLWNIGTGALIWTLKTGCNKKILFSPDNTHIFMCGFDERHQFNMMMFDYSRPQFKKHFQGHDGQVNTILLTHTGNHLISGGEDGDIRVWNTLTGNCEAVLTGHTDAITSIQLSEDERFLFSSSKDKSVRCWDLIKKEHIKTIDSFKEPVNKIVLMDNDRYILSTGIDGINQFELDWELKF